MTKSTNEFSRRSLLRALGVGAAGLALPGLLGGRARAQVEPPRRVVFFITPHGTVWNAWHMDLAGLGPSGSVTLSSQPSDRWSPLLAPFASLARKLMVVEGLSRPGAIEYEHAHDRQGDAFDLNRHAFGQAHLMTCVDPLQRPSATCIGGGVSIDQVLGAATSAPGRWASRVYGQGHPYSFVAAGEESPRVTDPRVAYDDIVGMRAPSTTGAGDARARAIRAARARVLGRAAAEAERLGVGLGRLDREKLARHAQLVRDLEASFSAAPGGAVASCSPRWVAEAQTLDQWSRVITLALSCDLTRTVTLLAPELDPSQIGLPPGVDVHQDYAHRSNRLQPSTYTAEAERGMVQYVGFFAQRFRTLLDQLDSVPEGDGTLLDHTAVVWMSELATGTHDLHDLPIVVAGGASGRLRTDRYVRYARDTRLAAGWGFEVDAGPAQNRFYVSLMQALGVPGDRFGITSVPRVGGGTMSLTGGLPELLV